MQSEPMQSDMPCPTADVRALIRNRIRDMRYQIDRLQALANVLPAQIPQLAAGLLFDLIEKHS